MSEKLVEDLLNRAGAAGAEATLVIMIHEGKPTFGIRAPSGTPIRAHMMDLSRISEYALRTKDPQWLRALRREFEVLKLRGHTESMN